MDYSDEQQLELEALEAIFADELQLQPEPPAGAWPAVGNTFKIVVTPQEDGEGGLEGADELEMELLWAHTARYPEEAPCLRLRASRGLSDADVDKCRAVLMQQVAAAQQQGGRSACAQRAAASMLGGTPQRTPLPAAPRSMCSMHAQHSRARAPPLAGGGEQGHGHDLHAGDGREGVAAGWVGLAALRASTQRTQRMWPWLHAGRPPDIRAALHGRCGPRRAAAWLQAVPRRPR